MILFNIALELLILQLFLVDCLSIVACHKNQNVFVTQIFIPAASTSGTMGDWSSLSTLLDKVQAHSTVVGKIWMSVLLVFRILVLGVAADSVWADEQSSFICNNNEPGCTLACYNRMFPVSYIRYWVLQILLVSTPTLVYLGHAVHVIHKERNLRAQIQSEDKGASAALKQPKYTDDRGKIMIKGVLLCSYLIQLVMKVLLEVGFVVGQFYIYDSPFMAAVFHCKEEHCSQNTGADCFISRPTEKSIFTVFMLAVAGVSVFLNLLEILYLICVRWREVKKKQKAALSSQQHYLPQETHPEWMGKVTHRNQYPAQQVLADVAPKHLGLQK